MSIAAEKTLKNYLYDNPDLKQSKMKKETSELGEIGTDDEIWILQCPKDFDPKKLLNVDLQKVNQSQQLNNMDVAANKFLDKKALAVISPEKAAEYQLVCENLKLVSLSYLKSC